MTTVRTQSPVAVLHVLDGPCLWVGDRPAAIPESSLRLLVFLAFRGRPAPRRTVAATLWPGTAEARAGGNLRSAIWRLRGAGVAVAEPATTGLALGADITTDLATLTGWAARVVGDAPPATGDLTVPDDVDAALDLLPGWYDDWAIAERERVRARVLHALEQVSRRLSATGRHAQAVDAAIAAVCADPLRESAQRALIGAHLAEGNLVEAQRAFAGYRELLVAELGVVPSNELWQLIAAARLGGGPVADRAYLDNRLSSAQWGGAAASVEPAGSRPWPGMRNAARLPSRPRGARDNQSGDSRSAGS